MTIHNTHTRTMLRREIPQALAIEREVFEFPWSEKDFHKTFTQQGVVHLVIESDDRIVGFMVYALHDSHIEIWAIAIAKGHQRRGLATALIDRLKSLLYGKLRNAIFADVCEENLAAQLFFKSQGFKASAIVPRPWVDCDCDAYEFQFSIHQRDISAATASSIREDASGDQSDWLHDPDWWKS